jgi:hypothetical protein
MPVEVRRSDVMIVSCQCERLDYDPMAVGCPGAAVTRS